MNKKWIILGGLLLSMNVAAQSTLWKNKAWECKISDKGTLEQIIFKSNQQNDTVPFFHKESNAGPRFYANLGKENRIAEWIPDGYRSYRATIDQVECRLTYKAWNGQPAVEITLVNKGNVPFQPVKAG